MLNDASSTDPQQQGKLLDIIVRNAYKLQNLAEERYSQCYANRVDICNSMEKIHLLHELFESAVSDFQAIIENEFDENENENSSKAVTCLKEQYTDDRADPTGNIW